MKRLATGIVLSVAALLFTTNVFAEDFESNIYTNPDEVEFQPDPEVIEIIGTDSGKFQNDTIENLENDNQIDPLWFQHPPGSLGTIYSPRKIDTDKIYNGSIPIEFTVIDGNFVLYEQQGYHYYVEGATQTWFNAATGHLASAGSAILKARLTYSISNYLPYVKNIYNTSTGKLIKENKEYVSALTAMVYYETPIIGPIAYTSVPRVGTKEVVVYVSQTGEANSYHHRFRLTIHPDGSYTVTKWLVP